MPFDGKAPQEPQFTPEFYSKMLDGFKDGQRWAQRTMRAGGRHCLLGMAYNVKYGNDWLHFDATPEYTDFGLAFAQSLGFRDTYDLVTWNDEDGRTWDQVEALLKAKGARMSQGLFARMMVLLRPPK